MKGLGQDAKLTVTAPARIHLGLLQMSRRYPVVNMGLGFAIASPRWVIELTPWSRNVIATGPGVPTPPNDLVMDGYRTLRRVQFHTGAPPVQVTICEAVRAHAGLGSKTSLLMALLAGSTALSRKHGTWQTLRYLTTRGGTSGVGVNTACVGGFVLDGGHVESPGCWRPAPSSRRRCLPLPSVIGRWGFPPWSMIVATSRRSPLIHGTLEQRVFDAALPLEGSEVDHLAGIVLYELLPALANDDLRRFAHAVNDLQEVGFKRAEWRMQPREISELRSYCLSNGALCAALSSMGPTLVMLSEDSDRLFQALKRSRFSAFDFLQTEAQNTGLTVSHFRGTYAAVSPSSNARSVSNAKRT